MIVTKVTACRVRRNTHMAVLVVKAAAVAVAPLTKPASSTSKVTKITSKTPECPGNLVYATPAECSAIGLRTAKQTLQRVMLIRH